MIRSHITPQQQDVEGAGGKAAIPAPMPHFLTFAIKNAARAPAHRSSDANTCQTQQRNQSARESERQVGVAGSLFQPTIRRAHQT